MSQSLISLTAEDMAKVEETLAKSSHSPIGLIPQLTNRLFSAGGKRMRAQITVATARMCGHSSDLHIALAAAVEMMHTATLFHDDVVDDSDTRRGAPTAKATAGNAASVLIGDFLLGQAFRLMVKTKSITALDILSEAASTIAEGEVAQLVARSNIDVTVESSIKIITAKTAALFAAAAQSGACIANASDKVCYAMHDYGLHHGIAFQLLDDLLDYAGDEATFGKTLGTDFHDKKVTIPVILALKYARENRTEVTAHGEVQHEFWQRVFSQAPATDQDFDTARTLIKQCNADQQTLKMATEAAQKSVESLSAVSGQDQWVEALRSMTLASIARLT